MISGQIITANRLADGVVVFLDPRNVWVERLAAGGVWTDAASAADALSQAKQDEANDVVVEPYLIDVVDKNGAVAAKHLREAIRAAGPTIRRDLGKQAVRFLDDILQKKSPGVSTRGYLCAATKVASSVDHYRKGLGVREGELRSYESLE